MGRLVCEALTRPVLDALLLADAYLPKPLGLALHSLYLTLMADQKFKMDISKSYTTVYVCACVCACVHVWCECAHHAMRS